MKTISKEEAVKMLQSIISDLAKLPREVSDSVAVIAPWDGWSRSAVMRVQRVFGTGSSQLKEVEDKLKKIQPQSYAHVRGSMSPEIAELIKSMLVEVSELWEDEPLQASGKALSSDKEQGLAERIKPVVGDQVFVVHGHDHGRLQTVARFIERLGLVVTILHERPSEGTTIIEKLETHGNASFAVVLLTPDDVGSVATQTDKLNPRARQNVVLELGYFLGRLGRRRVAALVSDGVELPSDYSGVMYIKLDDQGAWQFHLAKELRAAGLAVNADALL